MWCLTQRFKKLLCRRDMSVKFEELTPGTRLEQAMSWIRINCCAPTRELLEAGMRALTRGVSRWRVRWAPGISLVHHNSLSRYVLCAHHDSLHTRWLSCGLSVCVVAPAWVTTTGTLRDPTDSGGTWGNLSTASTHIVVPPPSNPQWGSSCECSTALHLTSSPAPFAFDPCA